VSKVIKMVLLSLMATAMLSLLFIAGCGDEEGTEPTPKGTEPTQEETELSQSELQSILMDSTLAVREAETYKFIMDIDMTTEVSGSSNEGEMDMTMSATGIASPKNGEMKMTMDMSMDMEGVPMEESMQNISMEMYMLEDSLYMKMDIPEMGEQWMKMPISEELKEELDLNMVDQQLMPLESPVEIEQTGYEVFDGSECYVLNIVPDMPSLMQWLGEQEMGNMEVDWESMEAIADSFKKLSYVCWIAKDSHLMKRMKADMLMEITGEQAGVTDGDFGKMIMDMSMDMAMFDYNEPVSIVLPDEAKNAMEMPY
jgi:hypothetical protein